jgi:hypothetical protein
MAMGPGVEAPVVLIQKKGNQARLEFTIQGLTAVRRWQERLGSHAVHGQEGSGIDVG